MPRIPDIGKKRIVIVGGGFGGMNVANSLRKLDAQIVLFDKQNHHTFQPLLYQVATSGLETSSIVYPFRKMFEDQKNFYFRLADVLRVDPEKNEIETSIGHLHYDYLILATGAATNYYGMKDIEENSVPMKTVEDAIQLRNKILRNFELALLEDDDEKMNSYMDFVIVGGGPTGVEVAGALAELKNHVFPHDYKELDLFQMDIHLIEAGPKLLGPMSDKSSSKAQEFLEKLGVKVHLNQGVKSYDGYTVTLGDGSHLISRSLIWAAGVAGKPLAGIDEKSTNRGRIMVDVYNKVVGYENIYAIGDIAVMITDATPKGHPMVAQPAIQQGQLLAKNIKRQFKGQEIKPFKYHDKGSMATIGRNKAVVELNNGLKMQGTIAWFMWLFVHLLYLVGHRNKIIVLFTWMWSYFSYDKSNRLIIGKSTNEKEKAVPA